MSDPGEVPTCYRHPDRETYVSCVRCGRHACPNCMRSASVGQQCVECVQDSNHGARPARNVFGGRAPARAGQMSGLNVTYALIAINVLLFLVELARPTIAEDWAITTYVAYGNPPALHGVATGEWYRLISSAFLPPPITGAGNAGGWGLTDIAFNMYALYLVGPQLERLMGGLRFLGIYLLSALGGSVMYYYLTDPGSWALGASGAVFGLFGAWFVVARRLRLDPRGILTLIVINLVLGFVVSRIAWQAHVGGLITGGLITAAYVYAPRKNQALVQGAATVAVIALAVLAVALRTHQLHQLYPQFAGT